MQAFPYDGVWLECDYRDVPSAFDPETFDFASACAERIEDDYSFDFVYGGVNKYFEGGSQTYCSHEGYFLGPSNRVYELDGNYFGLERENSVFVGGVLYAYFYDGCNGSCSPELSVRVLDKRDTSALNAQCLEADETSLEDDCSGKRFPFGPSGVGTLPPALIGMWLWCEEEDPEPCLRPGGRGGRRINADGTMDVLYEQPDGWYSDYCGSRVGATSTHLREFVCTEGSWGAGESRWEIQATSDATYLRIWFYEDEDPFVYIKAPDDFELPNDPCEGVQADCVIQ